MPRFPRRHLLLALLVVLPLAACGGDDDPSAGPTADDTVVSTTSTTDPDPTTSTATADPTPEQEVEAAYLEAFAAYFRAGTQPTEPHDLDAHFAGAALTAVEQNVSRLANEGLRSDFPDGFPVIDVQSAVLSGESSALLTGCVVDKGRKVVIADGSFVDEEPTSREVEAQLSLVDGLWWIVGHQTITEWPDDAGCER